MVLAAECLAHFSYEKSEGSVLQTDIQGVGTALTDPEKASSNIVEGANSKDILFCIGNYCRKAIKVFGLTHRCNK